MKRNIKNYMGKKLAFILHWILPLPGLWSGGHSSCIFGSQEFVGPKRTNERTQGHGSYYTFRIAIIFVDKYLGWVSSPAVSFWGPLWRWTQKYNPRSCGPGNSFPFLLAS